MVLRRFGAAETVEESYELPWLEEYVKRSGDKEAIERIRFVKFSEKGAMIYTSRYKAHIRTERQSCADLQEALPVYVERKHPVPALYCGADKNKRPILLQDDVEMCHRWNCSEERYIQVEAGGKRLPSEQARQNPLLAHYSEGDSAAEAFSAAERTGASTEATKVRAGKTK